MSHADAALSRTLTAVVLAAGAGTRMKSKTSKVLHQIAGRALLQYPVLAALRAGANKIIVVTSVAHRHDIATCLEELWEDGGFDHTATFELVIQPSPLGSGDAARAAIPLLTGGLVLVLNGDAPLIEPRQLELLVEARRSNACELAFLSCTLTTPYGYGRVVRDARGEVIAIREQKDLSDAEQALSEVNAGLYCCSAEFLSSHLPSLSNANAAGEFYITDLVAMAAQEGGAEAVDAEATALLGVNDRAQLHQVEQALYERIIRRHRLAGVTVCQAVSIDDRVRIGQDTFIGAGVSLRGQSVIGANVRVDQGSVVTDSTLDDGAEVKPYCVIERSHVGSNASVGPFAHLRPGADLLEQARVGNFVEIKASQLCRGVKVNHLSYVGDCTIGEHSNIGAGTIVCNYDGYSKHRTVIGDHVFVGSDSQLVAPLTIGSGAFVATGSTVIADVPEQSLVISRGRQTTKLGYAPQLRRRLQGEQRSKKDDE